MEQILQPLICQKVVGSFQILELNNENQILPKMDHIQYFLLISQQE